MLFSLLLMHLSIKFQLTAVFQLVKQRPVSTITKLKAIVIYVTFIAKLIILYVMLI